MHSKRSSNRIRRMMPYLITAGLGLSVVAHAAEPESPGEVPSEIPAPTIDTDGDGKMDGWDRSGDGQPDLFDDNGDGQPD